MSRRRVAGDGAGSGGAEPRRALRRRVRAGADAAQLRADEVGELGEDVGLRDEPDDAAVGPAQLTLAQVVGAREYDADRGEPVPDFSGELDAVQPRHHQVDERHVGGVLRKEPQDGVGVARADRVEALVAQGAHEQPHLVLLIVNDQHSCHRGPP